MTMISVNSIDEKSGNDNIFVFSSVKSKWEFVESFKEETKCIDVFFYDDVNYKLAFIGNDQKPYVATYKIDIVNDKAKSVLVSKQEIKL